MLYAMYGVNFMFCSIRLEFFFIPNETAFKLFVLFSLSARIIISISIGLVVIRFLSFIDHITSRNIPAGLSATVNNRRKVAYCQGLSLCDFATLQSVQVEAIAMTQDVMYII